MKKLLCIIMCAVLLLSATGVFAEDDAAMTRIEALKLLAERAGYSEKEYDCPFTDISEEDKSIVGYAFEKGWIKGTGDNLFNPEGEMTRECFLTMVLRSLKYTDPLSFTWDNPYDRAFIAGIYPEKCEGAFTKSEAAKILTRRMSAYSLYGSAALATGSGYTKSLSYVSSQTGKIEYLFDLPECTVVIGYTTGTPHGSVPRGSVVFKENGEELRLELPRISPWKCAAAEDVRISEENTKLYYTCSVEEDYIGMDMVTVVQKAGVFEYCVDLTKKETTIKEIEKN